MTFRHFSVTRTSNQLSGLVLSKKVLDHFHSAFQTWDFPSDEKEIVAKSYIGVMHFMKFFKLDHESVDDFFLTKFQSQIQHLVAPKEREWYSFERCRR